MSITVYDAKHYRDYLSKIIEELGSEEKGIKSKIAQAMQCQPAYLSRVMTELAELSLEQAERLATYLGLKADEKHYFLLMLQRDRASTPSLKTYFQSQMESVAKKQLSLKHRFQVKENISEHDRGVYYSAWIYAAIHTATSIPELQTKDALMKYFGISSKRVNQVLSFLTQTGLVKHQDGKYVVGSARIHLGADSPLIAMHHLNWRLKAMHAIGGASSAELESGSKQDSQLHYSSVVTMSPSDALEIKKQLIKAIEQFNQSVARSPEKEVFAFTLDFFGL